MARKSFDVHSKAELNLFQVLLESSFLQYGYKHLFDT